ncbi:MAG: CinA family nicotinamide mononucleotide deamidase-related protein [Parachlamydiales bacterium]|nr:CinA family nicotinamide mononucleotide deamidase-related protein [Parachlamydiales bacterium]
MKIEILAIGDELLSGKTINTNSAYISSKLLKYGYETHFHSVYSDEKAKLISGIKIALKRADLIIMTGGLGPTIDDNTKKIVCDLLKIPLKYREDIALDIKKRFGEIDSMKEQSTVPKGGYIFKNDIGTAPGFAFLHSGKVILLLPGVPKELEKMFDNHAMMFIQKHFPLDEKLFQERIDFFLLQEIEINRVLKTILTKDVSIGIYPHHGGVVNITLTAKAKNKDEFYSKIKTIKNTLLKEFSDNVFLSENGTIEEAIHKSFILKNKKLAFAESCTGGALSSKITKLAGSSKFFLGSFVTYSNEMKQNLLSISSKTLLEKGAVSIETVREMIDGVFNKTNADYAIAVSGIAGPSGATEFKPVGTICVAIGQRGDVTDAGILHFKGDRNLIIDSAVDFALGILLRRILHNLTYFEK